MYVDSEIALDIVDESHTEELFALVDSNRVYLRRWLPWVDSNTHVDHTREFIRLATEQHSQNLGFNCVIRFRNELCGVIGFHRIDWMNRNVEIGYWLGEKFQGKGIVTRSCRWMMNYAFEKLDLHRVQIRCATGNPKSCAIIERLELRFEGVARDAEFLNGSYVDLNVYGIVADEWREKQKRVLDRGQPP